MFVESIVDGGRSGGGSIHSDIFFYLLQEMMKSGLY